MSQGPQSIKQKISKPYDYSSRKRRCSCSSKPIGTYRASVENKRDQAFLFAFEGEGHGFRKSENIVKALESEYSFFSQIFGFEPFDDIESTLIV